MVEKRQEEDLLKHTGDEKWMAKSRVGEEKVRELVGDNRRILELLRLERARNGDLEGQLERYNE